MKWDELTQHAGEVGGAGAFSFIVAFFRSRKRLASVEKSIKALVRPDGALTQLKEEFARELQLLREEFQREFEHRRELEEVRDHERASRPDPVEELYRRLKELEERVTNLRSRGHIYVRTETFVAYNKSQEDSWKRIGETLGRLSGAVERLEKLELEERRRT
jgi:polyhydroxyalkanoate synthesis regulator phasin